MVSRLLGSMLALLVGAARAAGAAITGDFAGAGKAVDEAGNAVFGKTGFLGSDMQKPYEGGRTVKPAMNPMQDFANMANDPNNPYAKGGTTVNQANKVTINVNGAGDPNAVAAAVVDRQQAAMAFSNTVEDD